MRSSVPLLTATLLFGALLASARPARASTSYPTRLQAAVGAACVPQCTLCHLSNIGGPPVTGAFAQHLYGQGLRGDGIMARLEDVLATVNTAATDSDMDGTPDIPELIAGTDPSDPAPTALLCGTTPAYGCGARIASAPATTDATTPAAAAAITALLGLAAMRRRRARS